MPTKVLLKATAKMKGIGSKVARWFPYLEIELKQAELPFEKEQYGAIMFFLFNLYFVFIFIFSYAIGLKFIPDKALPLSITLGLIFSFLVMVQLSVFPKIRVMKKVRDLERNLIFALRTVLVEIRSGVSLFDAINLIANGNFGIVSREFKKAVESINTGSLEEDALESLASNNPSIFFRRAIWQIVNGLKAGADISDVLSALIDSLMKEQRNQIRQYGNKLRLLSLAYMMLGVIIPALGLTFLIILASFPQLKVGELLFWVLLGGIIIAQFMYLGVIKSSRPNLMAD